MTSAQNRRCSEPRGNYESRLQALDRAAQVHEPAHHRRKCHPSRTIPGTNQGRATIHQAFAAGRLLSSQAATELTMYGNLSAPAGGRYAWRAALMMAASTSPSCSSVSVLSPV